MGKSQDVGDGEPHYLEIVKDLNTSVHFKSIDTVHVHVVNCITSRSGKIICQTKSHLVKSINSKDYSEELEVQYGNFKRKNWI